MNTKRLSRRQFLQLSGGMLAASVLAGCVGPTATPTTTQTTAATQPPAATALPAATKPPAATQPPASKYTESPLLAALVTAGKLPGVDQRLPVNPLVVKPNQSVGKYGGMWRQSVPIGTKSHACAAVFYSAHGLIVYNEDMTKMVPNLAESVVVSADAKVYTITLRKNLKWSDGAPMDTKDIEFWWKAYATNTTLNPNQKNNVGVELNIIDDVTCELKYPTPQPLQFATMAEFQGQSQFMPAHYLKQFHPDYQTADVLEKQFKDAGFDDWGKYFADRNDYLNNPDLPTMGPWMLVTKGSGAAQLVFERNPYYWAVDTNGNQLPYIDSYVVNIVESPDIVRMKAISGEFEVALAQITENFADYPLYAENAEAGDYKVLTYPYTNASNAMLIEFNITTKDPVKRAIMEKVEFRKAMALAVNRPEIIAVNYTIGPNTTTPRNFAPGPLSPFFNLVPELATQYSEFDPDTANKMLDELGLDKRDADGMRLLPDGNVFNIVIDVPMYATQWIDVGTMVAKNYEDVGIKATARSIDPALWGQRMAANDFEATMQAGTGAIHALTTSVMNEWTGYTGMGWTTYFASGNYIWRTTKGSDGIEPSAAIKRFWELGTAIVIEPDEDKRIAILKEILEIHKDNLFVLGISTRLPGLYLVKNYVKNVGAYSPGWNVGNGGHARPEQFYIDKPA